MVLIIQHIKMDKCGRWVYYVYQRAFGVGCIILKVHGEACVVFLGRISAHERLILVLAEYAVGPQ